MKKVKYGICLMPSGNAYTKFSKIIKKLAIENGSENFAPHVTLAVVEDIEEGEFLATVKKLLSGQKVFKISVYRVDYLDQFYMCLFVRAKRTRELIRLNKKAQNVFGLQSRYVPHLSLMYGNFPEKTKMSIIKNIGRRFDMEFNVKTIQLIRAEGPSTREWKVIKKIRLK